MSSGSIGFWKNHQVDLQSRRGVDKSVIRFLIRTFILMDTIYNVIDSVVGSTCSCVTCPDLFKQYEPPSQWSLLGRNASSCEYDRVPLHGTGHVRAFNVLIKSYHTYSSWPNIDLDSELTLFV